MRTDKRTADLTDDELLDRLDAEQGCAEILVRYTRGIDRRDKELVLSVFHPDAHLESGDFKGKAVEFVEQIFAAGEPVLGQHVVTNVLVEVDGDIAWGESYFEARRAGLGFGSAPGFPTQSVGRYVDRFEKRDGDWRIGRRLVVMEWLPEETDRLNPGAFLAGTHDRDDPSYLRDR